MKKKTQTNSNTAILVIGGLGIASIIGLLSMKKAKANVVPQPALPSPSGGASAAFDDIMPFIKYNLEGGYQNHASDKGNYVDGKLIGTNHGISAPTLKVWLGRTPTVAEMKNLSSEEAYKIYYELYWKPFGASRFKDRNVASVLFDFTITSGYAIREFQKLLNQRYGAGLAEDNKLGPKTIAAANSVSDQRRLFEEIKAKRIAYYKTLDTWNDYGKGWTNRVNQWVYV